MNSRALRKWSSNIFEVRTSSGFKTGKILLSDREKHMAMAFHLGASNLHLECRMLKPIKERIFATACSKWSLKISIGTHQELEEAPISVTQI
jgi:hypothetical protein